MSSVQRARKFLRRRILRRALVTDERKTYLAGEFARKFEGARLPSPLGTSSHAGKYRTERFSRVSLRQKRSAVGKDDPGLANCLMTMVE